MFKPFFYFQKVPVTELEWHCSKSEISGCTVSSMLRLRNIVKSSGANATNGLHDLPGDRILQLKKSIFHYILLTRFLFPNRFPVITIHRMGDNITKSSTSERSAIWVTTLASFVAPFLISSVNVALPAIQKEFSADAVILSWVATSYILACAIFLVPVGKVADMYGRKKVFLWGMALFVLSTLSTVWVPSVKILVALRAFQGAASAMLMTTAVAIITSVVAPQRRGRAIGYYVAAVYIGLAAGPLGGGMIIQYLGWRWIFLGGAVLGASCIWITLKGLKGEWTAPPRPAV